MIPEVYKLRIVSYVTDHFLPMLYVYHVPIVTDQLLPVGASDYAQPGSNDTNTSFDMEIS